MAEIIRVDGSREEVLPADGKKFTLQELQGLVGGKISVLYFPDKKRGDSRRLVINEEASLIGLPENLAASEIASAINEGEMILGDAVLLLRKEARVD